MIKNKARHSCINQDVEDMKEKMCKNINRIFVEIRN